jgi:poly(3-hydroxybutyrate) depolymerase
MRQAPSLLVLVTALLAAVLAAGCGGGSAFPDVPTSEGPIGKGANGVWLFRPAGKPKTLVIYFHGQGGPEEAVPSNHLPWINHLVARGSAVIYPRYEVTYEPNPLEHVLVGVRAAMKRLDDDNLPVLVIGFSRGGALAVEYGAIAARGRVPVPEAIMSVFPASQGELQTLVDLSTLDPATALLFLVGDRDTVVRKDGARYLLARLQQGGFPADHIRLDTVRSHGMFVADHLAPLGSTAAAQAAFWRPADRILTLMREDAG